MSAPLPTEVQQRLSRVLRPSSNGRTAGAVSTEAPSPDDLDWFLFRSFPDCDVAPDVFARLVPVYEEAIRAGSTFDFELLYVRMLELAPGLDRDASRSLARAVAERAGNEGFDPQDSIAAIRFAIRVLPADDPFLENVLENPALERLRFHLTLDFVLDDRDLNEYLAVSYLRDGDPEADTVLAAFPVPTILRGRLVEFFADDACRERIGRGWSEWTQVDERESLAEVLEARLPGLQISRRCP